MKTEMLTPEEEFRLMKELEKFDTATVTNVIATYPGAATCLNLYSPWEVNWYSDQTLKVMFPELGATCGVAVTCVYGLPDATIKAGPGIGDVLHALNDSPKPAVLFIKQDFPEHLKNKIGLCGGNMSTAFKSMGCVGIVSDGPSRDLEEVRELGIQYMLTGLTAGHGPMAVKAVNVPVQICGMDVAPGEIVHMDVNGAVKFPRKYLKQVYENCCILNEQEERKKSLMAASRDPDEIAAIMSGNYK